MKECSKSKGADLSMFATMDSAKVLFTLICVAFSCFSFLLISCSTDSEIQALRAKLARAEQRAQTAESELERLRKEPEHGIPGSMQKRIVELEKLAEKAPQAMIEDVRIVRKKKDMDIYVTFNIKNRKDIKCFVNVYPFQRRNSNEKFQRLKNNKGDPIFISEEFTPKRVTVTRTVEFSISHAKLNVKQQRELRFDFQIYDKPTDSFLDTELYSESFLFDP